MDYSNDLLSAALADLDWLLKQPTNYDRCEVCAYCDDCDRNQEECARDAKWRGNNASS